MTVPAPAPVPAPDGFGQNLRRPLLVLAALRYLIPIAALPFAPSLIPDRIPLLTLIRPGKEVILLAGGLTRTDGVPGLLPTFLAYLPLMVGGVWVFFALGRAYADDLAAGEGPPWLARIVPPDRFALAQRVLAKRGPTVAILGRIAALPPTVIAAAAGTSSVATVPFLVADLVGAIISFALMFGIGIVLGQAYESGGPWITAGGVVVLIIGASLMSSWIQREADGADDETAVDG